MASWASRIFQQKARKSNRRPVASFRPRLEILEDRVVPALLPHQDVVLSNVNVQALYLGSNWSNAAISTTQFNGFLSSVVSRTSPYLAMLKAEFPGVASTASVLTSVPDSVTLPTGYLTDAAIQGYVQGEISKESPAPTLVFVFVQPGTVVNLGNNETSVNAFLAYHSYFSYGGSKVAYAVVPYHGSAGNAQEPWLTNPFDSMTEAASHELAEAITDPYFTGYYDRSGNEIGDIVNGSTVYLNGYAVQRESAIQGSEADFLAMTPFGATAGHAFSLGDLTSSPLPTAITGHAESAKSTIVSISAPGIDDFGQPMVDVVFSDGYAYEYHDFLAPTPTTTGNPNFFPWTYLGANVKQAAAGQGVSYVLFNNGNLGEFVDPNYATYYYGYGVNPGSRNGVIASGVTAITAGVDPQGVNAVEYVKSGKTYVWDDLAALSSNPTSTNFSSTKVYSTTTADMQEAQVALLTAGPVAFVTPFPVASNGASAFPHANQAVITVTTPTFPAPLNRVDGGGADSRLIDGQNADGATVLTSSDSPTPPVNLGDVPVFGPIFTEAVRQLKETRSMLPSGFMHAAPANPGGPNGTPESKAPPAGKARTVAVSGLLAVFGLGYLGLTRDERRRQRQPGV